MDFIVHTRYHLWSCYSFPNFNLMLKFTELRFGHPKITNFLIFIKGDSSLNIEQNNVFRISFKTTYYFGLCFTSSLPHLPVLGPSRHKTRPCLLCVCKEEMKIKMRKNRGNIPGSWYFPIFYEFLVFFPFYWLSWNFG